MPLSPHGHTSLGGSLVGAHLEPNDAGGVSAHVLAARDVVDVAVGAHGGHALLGGAFVGAGLEANDPGALGVHGGTGHVTDVAHGAEGHAGLGGSLVRSRL